MAKKPTKKAANDTAETLVTFLLDSTQSMNKIKASTLEAFNTYVDGLKNSNANMKFTLVTFNRSQIKKVHFETPIADVPEFKSAQYSCEAMTPLVEAAIKTIQALAKAIAAKDKKPKVVFCIQTDGDENCSSSEYTWDALNALIKEKQKEGWQFNFMGAGIDAYEQGAKMGISKAATVSYDHTDRAATRSVFGASASNTANFASGLAADTTYNSMQKMAAKDRWEKNNNPGPLPSAQLPHFVPTVFGPIDHGLDLGGVATITKPDDDLDLSKG